VPRITTFCIYIYVFGCRLSLFKLCDSDFGIIPVAEIIIIIIIIIITTTITIVVIIIIICQRPSEVTRLLSFITDFLFVRGLRHSRVRKRSLPPTKRCFVYIEVLFQTTEQKSLPSTKSYLLISVNRLSLMICSLYLLSRLTF
jgi:hypothetical protein